MNGYKTPAPFVRSTLGGNVGDRKVVDLRFVTVREIALLSPLEDSFYYRTSAMCWQEKMTSRLHKTLLTRTKLQGFLRRL